MLVSMSFKALKEIVKWSSQTRAIQIALKSILLLLYMYAVRCTRIALTHSHALIVFYYCYSNNNIDNNPKSPYIRMIRNQILELFMLSNSCLALLWDRADASVHSSLFSVKKIISAWEMITIFGIYFLCQFHGYDFAVTWNFCRRYASSAASVSFCV